MKMYEHLPTLEELKSLGNFTSENPMVILMSACLLGDKVMTDGTSYIDNFPDFYSQKFASLPNVKAIKFCPENYAIGTPRGMPDLHGGNGFDVLDGKAWMKDEKGNDFTKQIIEAAYEMLKLAKDNGAHLALLVDMSASCGSNVISDGCRLVKERKFQYGPGVCPALLLRNGIKVISQRDYKSLERLYHFLVPEHKIDEGQIDYHETSWVRENQHLFRRPST